jgi:tRNA dimethylallyltransferase
MTSARTVLIAGPTASGKSAAALAISRALGGIIINADSMQVYRELRLLTARPSLDDEAKVPHRLFGHVSGHDAYSVACWLQDVEGALNEARNVGKTAVIVGGTGLYFKALLEGLAPVPAIPAAVREHWRRAATQSEPAHLHRELARRDPEGAARLAPGDRQRIVRALEVFEATGRPLAHWQAAAGRALVIDGPRLCKLVLSPPRPILHARCNRRFDQMLDEGALDEVRALAGLRLDRTMPVMRALGVAPLIAHLEGRLTLAEAAERAKAQTRQYVKRQDTWLRRHMADWRWILAEDPAEAISEILPLLLDR